VKNVLVTGGAGFIGSNLVHMLIKDYSCRVTILDDMFTGRLENIKHFRIDNDVDIVNGSVLDSELLLKLMRGKDTVFHLAAVNIIASMENPRADLQVNIIGTYNVLEASLQAGIERVVYASTSSVYGNPRYLPVCEEDGVRFLSFYSASKYAGESYAQVFYEQYGLPVTIVRYSNVYGYNQRPENPYTGVIARFIKWALNNAPLKIHGDGSQTRDFTFVEDACNATILAGSCARAIGETYNIRRGEKIGYYDTAGVFI
jgi:UDP-glucose 4-epimerase